MWENMNDELKQTYGKDYVDTFVSEAENAIPLAMFDCSPVITAMTHALFAQSPNIRYFIPGSSSSIEIWKVRTNLTFTLD